LLNSADIVLLLVSADFIASDYCWGEEMTRALPWCPELVVVPGRQLRHGLAEERGRAQPG
jgi:hypothetical protein